MEKILDEIQAKVNLQNYSNEEVGRAVKEGVRQLDNRVSSPKEDELPFTIQLSKQVSSIIKSMVIENRGKYEN